MSNHNIEDLRSVLFDTIADLRNGRIDVDKAKAIADLARVEVDSAKVEVDMIRVTDARERSTFLNQPKGLLIEQKEAGKGSAEQKVTVIRNGR